MSKFMQVIAQQQALLSGGSGGVVAGQYALIGTGTQYIDWGFGPSDAGMADIDIKVVGMITNSSGLGTILFGAEYNAEGVYQRASLFLLRGVNTWVSWGRGNSVNTITPLALNQYFTHEKQGSDLLIDSIVYSTPLSAITNPTPANYHSFGAGFDGGLVPNLYNEGSKQKTVELWTGTDRSEYVVNAWPVPAGMTAQGASTPAPSNCMYDAVSNTYFENQGTGTFGIETL